MCSIGGIFEIYPCFLHAASCVWQSLGRGILDLSKRAVKMQDLQRIHQSFPWCKKSVSPASALPRGSWLTVAQISCSEILDRWASASSDRYLALSSAQEVGTQYVLLPGKDPLGKHSSTLNLLRRRGGAHSPNRISFGANPSTTSEASEEPHNTLHKENCNASTDIVRSNRRAA